MTWTTRPRSDRAGLAAIEAGAGARSRFSDQVLKDAGAEIVANGSDAVGKADVLLTVRRPSLETVKALKDIAEGEGDLTRRLEVATQEETLDLLTTLGQLQRERLQDLGAAARTTVARDFPLTRFV